MATSTPISSATNGVPITSKTCWTLFSGSSMTMSAIALPSISTTGSRTVAIVTANDGRLSWPPARAPRPRRTPRGVRRLDHDPAAGDAAEQRAGDDDGRDRDQQAEPEGDPEVGAEELDRGDRSRVRRHEAVHRREAGQRRDADGDQRDLGAPGDQVDHRHQQHQADLEEHRQADDRPDRGHRPRQQPRPEARPTIVSTTWSAPPESASSLANIAPSAISTPTPAAVVPNPVVNDAMTSREVLAGDGADGEPAQDQREERVELDDRDQEDEQRDRDQRRGDQLPAGRHRLDDVLGQHGEPRELMSVLLADAAREVPLDDLVDTPVDARPRRRPRPARAARGSRTARSSSDAGMKCPGAAGLPAFDDLAAALEVQELHGRAVVAQLVAVLALAAPSRRSRRRPRAPASHSPIRSSHG